MALAFTTPLSLLHHKHPKQALTPLQKPTENPPMLIKPLAKSEQPDNESIIIPPTRFPKLYDAWFPPHELKEQMQESVTRAFNDSHRLIELKWPVVPNLEEISAGTLLNFKFGKLVASTLDMQTPENYMLIKRYLAPFCNLYWAIAVAQSAAFKHRKVWAVSTDGVSKTAAKNVMNVQVANLTRLPEIGDEDIVIIIDPRVNDVWKRGVKLRPKDGATVFLNSEFSESYGLTGPRKGVMKDIQTGYLLKRVTRGYGFYAYPGPWRGILEKPDMSIEEVGVWEKQPSLRVLASCVRNESNRRYGGFYNDRYVRGFGGRL